MSERKSSYFFSMRPKIAIVASRYRPEIIDLLTIGAGEEIQKHGGSYDVFKVHGSYELPTVISYLDRSAQNQYDAYVALGCVLKGETIHDEVIARAVYDSLQRLATDRNLAIGSGVLTVNTQEQAFDRADPKRQNRGAEAALAALDLLQLKQDLNFDV
tara:strand:+ start:616 stop:1089 length:474 start_codon:yes stop_codon:yes gene_type:complete